MSEPFVQAGARLSVDRGDGLLSRLMGTEIQGNISVNGTLDGYGRTMRFGRYGLDLTPLRFSILESMRAVLLTAFLGTPGSITATPIFYGAQQQAAFVGQPPSASIDCQDVSVLFSNVPFSYYLAPRTPTSRLEVLVDVINQYGIPCDLDSLDLGNNDGGYVYKGINEAGSHLLLDWIRDFLAPIGRHLYFGPDGYMKVFRLDETAAAVATLQAADVISINETPPAVNEKNAVTVSALCFPWIGAPGQVRTIQVIENGPSSSSPLITATSKQDHTTGVLSSAGINVIPSGPRTQKITTTTYYEGSITFQKIQEYGYYAPIACKDQQNGAGVVSYNSSFDVFQYPDLTWRTVEYEQWLLLKETRITKTYGGANFALSLISTEKDYYTAIEMPIATRDAGGVETAVAGFLTPDGRSWWGGRQTSALDTTNFAYEPRVKPNGLTEKVETTYPIVDDDKQITRQTDMVYLYGQYYWPNYTTVPTNSRDVFGPSAGKRYAAQSNAGSLQWISAFARNFNITTATNGATQYGYKLQNNGSIFGAFGDAIECIGAGTAPTSRSYGSVAGYTCQMQGLLTNSDDETFAPMPAAVLEYRTDQQTPQSVSSMITDDVRIALAGAQFDDFSTFENCEIQDELAVVAWEKLRLKSATKVVIRMPMNADITEGTTIALAQPETAGGTRKLVTYGMDLEFDGNGGALQTLHALYFPPNLAATVT